jgi:hypothetical protein
MARQYSLLMTGLSAAGNSGSHAFEIHSPDKILHFGNDYVGYCKARRRHGKRCDTAGLKKSPRKRTPREDFSQAPARIAKEATRDSLTPTGSSSPMSAKTHICEMVSSMREVAASAKVIRL